MTQDYVSIRQIGETGGILYDPDIDPSKKKFDSRRIEKENWADGVYIDPPTSLYVSLETYKTQDNATGSNFHIHPNQPLKGIKGLVRNAISNRPDVIDDAVSVVGHNIFIHMCPRGEKESPTYEVEVRRFN